MSVNQGAEGQAVLPASAEQKEQHVSSSEPAQTQRLKVISTITNTPQKSLLLQMSSGLIFIRLLHEYRGKAVGLSDGHGETRSMGG